MASNSRVSTRARTLVLALLTASSTLAALAPAAVASHISGGTTPDVIIDVSAGDVRVFGPAIEVGPAYDLTFTNITPSGGAYGYGYSAVGLTLYSPSGSAMGSPRDAYMDGAHAGQWNVTFPSASFGADGYWTLRDSTGATVSTFLVGSAGPVITSFTPSFAYPGDAFAAEGSGFGGMEDICFYDGFHTCTGIGSGYASGTLIEGNVPLVPAGTYWLNVTTTAGRTTSPMSMTVGSLAPANDDFADAIVIPSTDTVFTHSVSTVHATDEAGEPRPCYGISRTVWYSWTAPADGSVDAVVSHTDGSSFDTVLVVYTGATLDGLSFVTCDDDSGAGVASRVGFSVVGGTTYQFQVGGYGGGYGDLEFRFEASAPVPVPDLIITSVSMEQQTDGVNFSVVVRNIGDATAADFRVRVNADWVAAPGETQSEYIPSAGPLPAGEARVLEGTARFRPVTGDTNVTADADADGWVAESSESNNSYRHSFSYSGPTPAGPALYGFTPSYGRVGISITAYGQRLDGVSAVCFWNPVTDVCHTATFASATSTTINDIVVPAVPVGYYLVNATTPGGVATSRDYFEVRSLTSAIIDNNVIQLGVLATGNLGVYEGSNVSNASTWPTGLRYVPTNHDATAPGCVCEGWGVGDVTSGARGYANVAGGTAGLVVENFTADDRTATSIVRAGETFRVTHEYYPALQTANLYEVRVTIENIGPNTVDTRYRRVMDWDIEPTAFREYVSIWAEGCSASPPTLPVNVVYTSNNGFASADPLSGPTSIGSEGCFLDAGPADHGALFDFTFGMLEPGANVTFMTYYGANSTAAGAFNDIRAVGAEIYSLGKPISTDPSIGGPNTFAFGFRGVGGPPVTAPPPTHTPTAPLFVGTIRADLPQASATEESLDRLDMAVFGLASGATVGYDSGIDAVEPPAPPTSPWVRTLFDYASNPADFRKLHRSMNGTSNFVEWPLTVETRPADPDGDGLFNTHTVHLSWAPADFDVLGDDYALLLIDGANVVNMRGTGTYSFTQDGGAPITTRNYLTRAMTIRLELAGPDLALSIVGGTPPGIPTASGFVTGHTTVMRFRVDNLGPSGSTGGTATFYADGEAVGTYALPPISAGGIAEFDLPWMPEDRHAGTRHVRMVIDGVPGERESALGNNVQETDVFVEHHAHDLVLGALPGDFTVGPARHTQSFDVTVNNLGNVEDSFALSVDAPEGWTVEVTPGPGPVPVGGSATFTVTVTAPDANGLEYQTHTLFIQASSLDPHRAVGQFATVRLLPRGTLELGTGWQLVSLPVAPLDAATTSVLGATAVAYEWLGSGYGEPATLQPGVGYWVYVDAPTTIAIDGDLIAGHDTAALPIGWTLIGGTSADSAPVTTMGGAMLGELYGWPAGSITYTPTGLVAARGAGYWAFAEASGTVIRVGSP